MAEHDAPEPRRPRKCVRIYEISEAAMGFPAGSRMSPIGVNDSPGDTIMVRVEHGSFDHVPEGEVIPIVRWMGAKTHGAECHAADMPSGLLVDRWAAILCFMLGWAMGWAMGALVSLVVSM